MKAHSLFVLLLILTVASCRRDPLAKMPEFNILLPDSLSIFNTANIPEGKTTVIIRFDAYCGDCQDETDSLIMNMEQLKDINFYFVTIEKFDQVRVFRDHFKLYNYPNIVIGQDYNKFTPSHYKSRQTPLLAIYNRHNDLVTIYNGKPLIKDLIQRIRNVK